MKIKSNPSLEPQKINKNLWYYETRGHVEIIQEVESWGMGKTHFITSKIPWTRLLASAKRCRPEEFKREGA